MKEQKRKGFEYYRSLTKKQQKQFRKNSHCYSSTEKGKLRLEFNMNKVFSFNNFIFTSFIWSKTPQGHEYWEKISKKC